MKKRCFTCMELLEAETEVCPCCKTPVDTPQQQSNHLPLGTILNGRFMVGRTLGFGSFGITYAAWDSKLETRVAIKEYLPSDFATRAPGTTQVAVMTGLAKEQYDAGLERYYWEASNWAQFSWQPGIVAILDYFKENATAYIVMELLQGETLKDYLARMGG